MKKISLVILTITLCISGMAQDIKLPSPMTKGGMPLYDALMLRQTNRQFSSKPLDNQILSDMLWCANGINRKDGKRTAPSARNAQEIDIYVFNEKGVFLYVPEENLLKMVLPEDHRAEMSGRGGKMITSAPVTLLFFANYEKMEGFDEAGREFYGATDAGYVSQNVYLYCASNKLNTVVMGAIDRPKIMEFLKAKGKPILAQPVGYPEK